MTIKSRPLTSDEDEKIYKRVAFLFSQMYNFMNHLGLIQRLAPNGEEAWMNTIRKSLGKLNSIYVAFDDDEIVGFAAGNIRLSPNYLGSKKIGYISHVFVDPDYRKKRIGVELVSELEKWFEEKNVAHIELEVLSKNESAYKFWERSGFVMDNFRMLKKI